MITLLFWTSVLFILYTYLGYPLLIRARAQDFPQTPAPMLEHWPDISIIIPVHNEAHHIEAKLNNLRALDYPQDKLHITFVSDGSEDNTNDLLRDQAGINFIEYQPRQGKPTALNTAVEQQTTDLLVFTDARQMLAPDAVQKLVARLVQPGVGAVSGELCFGSPTDSTAHSVGLYWRYEKALRQFESQVHSVAGVTGALYAIRRQDYVPLYKDALLDDFEVPIQILKKGKRVLFEPGAFVYDQAQADAKVEKTRKIRTLTGNFQSFAHNKWLFSRENPILWQFISHKVCRLVVPYAMIIAFVSNVFLFSPFYRICFIFQLCFYGMGFAAMLSPRLQKLKIPSFAAVFIRLNWAAVLGFIRYRQKQVSVRWEKTS